MQAVNHTVEIERLYEELRECLQANDQAGVQRIFAELVNVVAQVRAQGSSYPSEERSVPWHEAAQRPRSPPRQLSAQSRPGLEPSKQLLVTTQVSHGRGGGDQKNWRAAKQPGERDPAWGWRPHPRTPTGLCPV